MSYGFQPVQKLCQAISQLNNDDIFDIPIVICYNSIVKAKSAEAKSRLAYTVFLFAKEESRRISRAIQDANDSR